MNTGTLSLSQELDHDLDHWQPALSKKEKENYRRVLLKIMEKRQSLPEIFAFTKEEMEYLYNYGYDFYKKGKYSDATGIFAILNSLDQNNSKYAMGFAAALQMQKEYHQAIDVYKMAAILNVVDPRPLYYMAECYLQSEDKVSAAYYLGAAIIIAGDNPKYFALKERAILVIQKLYQEATP